MHTHKHTHAHAHTHRHTIKHDAAFKRVVFLTVNSLNVTSLKFPATVDFPAQSKPSPSLTYRLPCAELDFRVVTPQQFRSALAATAVLRIFGYFPPWRSRLLGGGLTSQRGRDEEVGSIFLDDGLDELLSGGSAAQQPHAALELRHERHRVPDQVPPLDGRVPHLPTCKFPVTTSTNTDAHMVNDAGFISGHLADPPLSLTLSPPGVRCRNQNVWWAEILLAATLQQGAKYPAVTSANRLRPPSDERGASVMSADAPLQSERGNT